MVNPVLRAKSLMQNVNALSPLVGGPHKAFMYLLTSRGNNAAEHEARYKGIPFRFRRGDLPALREIFINEEYGFLRPFLQNTPKPVIIDVGAHIGLFAIWVFSVNPDAVIHSIEASPGTYKILAGNAKKTGKFNWHVENRAAWGADDHISFSDDSGSTMSHRVSNDGGAKIKTITLPGLMEKIGQIDLLKVDIEGAEESFLGRQQNIPGIKSIVVELHPNLCDAVKVTEVLGSNFGNIQDINAGTSGKPLLYCRK